MSSKGISFPALCSGMESNATTYFLCGIAAFVIWNLVSYAKNSGGPKKRPTPNGDERNGGSGVVPDELSTLAPSPAGDAKDNDHLGNGFMDRDDSQPARDRGESKKSPPTKRDGRNGAVTMVVTKEASSPAGDLKINHWGNGIAGRIKSEPGHDQDAPVELRSSEATQGCDELRDEPEREENQRTAATVNGVEARRPSADRQQSKGWKGEGPHTVQLLRCGWTEEDLDVHQRPIEVYAWFDHLQSCDCSFELAVILQDKKRRRVAEYQHDSTSCKPAVNLYKKVSLIFQNYGVGVRYVTYTHRRRKSTNEECKGHPVSEMYSGLRKLLKINNFK